MSHAAYPTGADVQQVFVGTSLVLAGLETVTGGPLTPGTSVSVGVASSAGFAVGDVVALDVGTRMELCSVDGIPDATHITLATVAGTHSVVGVPVVLTLLGRVPWSAIDWDGHAFTGAKDLEASCGRVFIAVSSSRPFDPPRGFRAFVDLHADLASLTSVSISGTPQTLDTDFYLVDANAAADGLPYWAIEFVNPFNSSLQTRRSIVVTGYWGYSLEIPEDVFDAMVDNACIHSYAEVSLSISGGIQSRKEGDEAVTWGNVLKPQHDVWQAHVDECVRRYKRPTVGL